MIGLGSDKKHIVGGVVAHCIDGLFVKVICRESALLFASTFIAHIHSSILKKDVLKYEPQLASVSDVNPLDGKLELHNFA